jgi:hypothetical protein
MRILLRTNCFKIIKINQIKFYTYLKSVPIRRADIFYVSLITDDHQLFHHAQTHNIAKFQSKPTYLTQYTRGLY